MTTPRLALVAAVLTIAAPQARAFHRTTPPVVPITTSGDDPLPRLPSLGDRLSISLGSQIFRFDRHLNVLDPVTTTGDNANPTISSGGSIIAWDTDCDLISCQSPGRQIFMRAGPISFQATFDETGTSANPSLNGRGNRLAFESGGDLAATGTTGISQIFLRLNDESFTQISSGLGASRNATLSKSGRAIAFDSTSDSVTGADTGVSQIWLSTRPGDMKVLTAGAAPSRKPVIAANGRMVAFESRADLAGDGSDTGKWQIFAYDVTTGAYYQVTKDPVGCTSPSIDDISAGDFRVGYSCNGHGYLHNVRANTRYLLPIPAEGDTPQAVVELGVHFVVVSTTADMMNGSGTTAGHQIYLLNLFKLPATSVPSDEVQF